MPTDIAAELVGLRRRVRKLETAPRLAFASLDNAPLRSFGEDGRIKATFGAQPDGGHAYVSVEGPIPLQPTDAVVKGGALSVEVTWDGNLIGPFGEVDAELPVYSNFEACEIHVGQSQGFLPSPETLATEFGRLGGTQAVPAPVGQAWIRLRIRSQSQEWGPPSPAVMATVTSLVDTSFVEQLETDLTQLAVDLGAAEQAMEQLELDLEGLDTRLIDAETTLNQIPTVISALDSEITTAQGMLDAAFPGGAFDISDRIAQVEAAGGRTWTQPDPPPAGTTYRWVGAPNASTSEKLVDGVVVARNYTPDPASVKGDEWSVVGEGNPTPVIIDGESAIPVIESGDGSLYVDPVKNPYEFNEVGKVIYLTFEAKVITPMKMRGRIPGYGGNTTDETLETVTQAPEDGWVKHTASAVVTAANPGGWIRALAWPIDTGSTPGVGFYTRRWVISENPDVEWFHGDMLDSRAKDLWVNTSDGKALYTWDGATNSWMKSQDEAIAAAQAAANGKNKNTYTDVTAANRPGPAPTAASGTGRTVGDVHRNRNATTGEIYAEWRWSGSAWQVNKMADEMFTSVDVGKLTAGAAAIQQAVIQKLAVQIATVIQLNADRITAGKITSAQIDTTNLAAALATILELNADRITAGQLDTARINVQELAAQIATVIELNADRITAGKIATARLDAEAVAAAVGEFISLSANQITAGALSATVTVSGVIRTAQTGARVEMNSGGLYGFNSVNQHIFRVVNGEVFVQGDVRAGAGTSVGGGIVLKPDGTVLGESVILVFGKGVSTEQPGQVYFETVVIPNRRPGGVSTQMRSMVVRGPRTSTGSSAMLTLGYSTAATGRGLMALDAHDLTVDLQGVMELRSVGETKMWAQGGMNLTASGPLTVYGAKVVIDSGASVADSGNPQMVVSGPWVSIESNLGSLAGGVSLDSPVVWVKRNRLNFAGTENSPKFYIGTADSGAIILRAAAGVGIALDADNASNRLLLSLSGQLAHANTYGNTTSSAANVNILSNGVFRRSTSLRKHKLNVETLEVSWDTMGRLRPVTWTDRRAAEELADWMSGDLEADSTDIEGIHPQVGLIAEEVETLGIPGLVTRDNDGNLAGVAYERLAVAMWPLMMQLKQQVDDLTTRLDQRG